MPREYLWEGYLHMAQDIADYRSAGGDERSDYDELPLVPLALGWLSYLGVEPPAGMEAAVERKRLTAAPDSVFLETLEVVKRLMLEFGPATKN